MKSKLEFPFITWELSGVNKQAVVLPWNHSRPRSKLDRPLSVPNVSENKGPFWHVKTHKVRTQMHCKMQSFPSLTYIVRTIHVFQTDAYLHRRYQAECFSELPFAICQRAFHGKEREIAEVRYCVPGIDNRLLIINPLKRCTIWKPSRNLIIWTEAVLISLSFL